MKYKTLLRLFLAKIIPIDRRLVLFSSFNGHYSDNPRYVSEALHKIAPDIKIAWIIDSNNVRNLPDYVQPVKRNSWNESYYRGKARVMFDNVFCLKYCELNSNRFTEKLKYKLDCWLRKKNNQLCISTWHGTPLKRMLRDQIGATIVDCSAPNLVMVHGNSFTRDIMDNILYRKVRHIMLGTARNDILYHNNDIELIKKRLGLPREKKVILYAPSFRSNGYNEDVMRSGVNQLGEMNIVKLCEELKLKFGSEWVLACRFHYHVDKYIDWSLLKKKYGQMIINANQSEDMSEYLSCVDALVTDVSSCMFDYMLSHKPVFLFFPDLTNYMKKERGFYTDIFQLPFSTATSFTQLLKDISEFNYDTYRIRVDNLIKDWGYVNHGHASQDTAEYIIRNLTSKIL